MKEIKFRGISLLTGKFALGSYVKTDHSQTGAIIIGLSGFGHTEVKPETVGQYTGLKDKNGVEIYEGDILNIFYVKDGFIHDGVYTVSVSASGVKFRFVGLSWEYFGYNQYPFHSYLVFSEYGILRSDYRNHDKPDRMCISDIDGCDYSNYFVIIGNIHQNHELLEQK